MRPLIAYTLFKDLNVGDFVFVKPHDPNLVPLWMGKMKGDVIKDKESEYF
jgi:signal peptidase I